MKNHPSLVSMPFKFDIDPYINSLSQQSQTIYNMYKHAYTDVLYLKS